jgi:transcription antitermination factor NusG
MLNWYVIMSKPGLQDNAAKRLASADMDVFNPKIRQYSQKKKSYIVKALFPMYFFAKFDAEEQYKMVKYTRGVLRVLGTNKEPVPIDEEIVLRVRSNCNTDEIVEAKYFEEDLKEGMNVTITDGPFAGVDAIITGLLNDEQRIEVLMNLMKISIKRMQIKKK